MLFIYSNLQESKLLAVPRCTLCRVHGRSHSITMRQVRQSNGFSSQYLQVGNSASNHIFQGNNSGPTSTAFVPVARSVHPSTPVLITSPQQEIS